MSTNVQCVVSRDLARHLAAGDRAESAERALAAGLVERAEAAYQDDEKLWNAVDDAGLWPIVAAAARARIDADQAMRRRVLQALAGRVAHQVAVEYRGALGGAGMEPDRIAARIIEQWEMWEQELQQQ